MPTWSELTQILVALATLWAAVRSARSSTANRKSSERVEHATNSMKDQLIEAARLLAHHEGHREGMQAGREAADRERSERDRATP